MASKPVDEEIAYFDRPNEVYVIRAHDEPPPRLARAYRDPRPSSFSHWRKDHTKRPDKTDARRKANKAARKARAKNRRG